MRERRPLQTTSVISFKSLRFIPKILGDSLLRTSRLRCSSIPPFDNESRVFERQGTRGFRHVAKYTQEKKQEPTRGTNRPEWGNKQDQVGTESVVAPAIPSSTYGPNRRAMSYVEASRIANSLQKRSRDGSIGRGLGHKPLMDPGLI